jgi:hypothetical protein
MMSTLAADGYSHLAYELFVLCESEEATRPHLLSQNLTWIGGRSMAHYGRFNAEGEIGFERFRTGVQVCKPGPELQAPLPFFVPYILKTIVGDIYR